MAWKGISFSLKGVLTACFLGIMWGACGPCCASTPLLVEITLQGSQESPLFTPNEITLDAGQEYLFVLNNEEDYNIIFHYGKLGQSVFTHYLQGSNSVTEDSFTLPAKTKVLWHFVTVDPGEFPFYAGTPSVNGNGKAGKISISGAPDPNMNPVENPTPQKTAKPRQERKHWGRA